MPCGSHKTSPSTSSAVFILDQNIYSEKSEILDWFRLLFKIIISDIIWTLFDTSQSVNQLPNLNEEISVCFSLVSSSDIVKVTDKALLAKTS